MKKIKRKLICSGIVAVCGVSAIAASSRIPHKTADDVLPASAARFESTPVIILDAGHGAST